MVAIAQSNSDSNSASVVSEEVVQNVGPVAGLLPLVRWGPICFTCKPGDDIMTKISLDCETHNRTLVSIMSMQGAVKNPSIVIGNNQVQTHEGARPLLSMNMTNLGNNGGSSCIIAIVGADGIPYGGKVSGPLIAASNTDGVLLVNHLDEDLDDEDTGSYADLDDEDSGSYADSNEDSDCESCITSA